LTRRFYEIVKLIRGHTIEIDGDHLAVDLDRTTNADLISNDQEFAAAVAPDAFFWISGGGTFILNGRWLPLVQRSAQARVNPGLYSLFTGRANNRHERARPGELVRELFEELLLFSDGRLLVPRNSDYQAVIDNAHALLRSEGNFVGAPGSPLPLVEIKLPDAPLLLTCEGTKTEHRFAWHIDSRNDVNVLFLFGAECDLQGLTAQDGEFQRDHRGLFREERRIVLYDFSSGNAFPLSVDDRVPFFIPTDKMSAHLQFFLRAAMSAGLPR
jgi:hypothetical protein